jgi:phytoene synthase
MDSPTARLTRQSGTSFYYAFQILPEAKRRAIYALYSFCRAVDDCVDEEGGGGEAGLQRWQGEVARCYAGAPSTELGRDLAQAIARFPIPRACLEDIVDGCRMDLVRTRYATFEELRGYCRRVASAVGLASIEIFGYKDPATRRYAEELGHSLQLTNILRDLGTDADRGRIYLPLEDLRRFDVAEDAFLDAARGKAPRPPGLGELLAFEAERTRGHYSEAKALLPAEDRRSMASAEVMGAVYRELLEEVVRRGFPLRERVTLSRPRKAWIAARSAVRTFTRR